MAKYATISVPLDVKRVLEQAKGSREWGDFLLGLYSEAKRLRSKRAFEELVRALTGKDLDAIAESSREFRERFALR